jgi:hypothetical protein
VVFPSQIGAFRSFPQNYGALRRCKFRLPSPRLVLLNMNDTLIIPIAEASWSTTGYTGQGTTITLAQEIALMPSPSSCCPTPTVQQISLDELLDSDGPCGDRGRPFSYNAEGVYSWLCRFFGSHERLAAFLSVAREMEIGDCLTVLGAAWTGFDYIAFDSMELFNLLDEKHVDYESTITQMMTLEERRVLDAQPDDITIYRGCGPRNEFGFSWTLDRAVATAFPFKSRYTTEYPMLLTATIKKGRAAALKLDRNEQEIILFDDADEQSFGFHYNVEPIRRDPAGNLVESWADDPNGELIDAYLEKWHCL